MEKYKHIPVLVNEVLSIFEDLGKKSLIMDGTLGLGGHSKALLEKGFRVIGVDRDFEAIKKAKKKLKAFENIKFIHDNFSNIGDLLKKLNIEKVEGILLDLGVSTYQLEDEKRGFGFTGELDMRMNRNEELTAKDVVNKYSYNKLKKIFNRHGAKVYAGEVCREIIESREKSEIKTSEELFEIIKKSLPRAYRNSRKHHYATPYFRALRIEVNQDIKNLEKFLDCFFNYLKKQGVLCIITFHSIEDKVVKRKFQSHKKKIKIITKNPIKSTPEENKLNPKAKRARLWVAQKR